MDSFYIPCLQRANVYKRAVGYFTSSSLSVAAKGLASFLAGNGKMYLVASPHLSEADAEAIKSGYKARDEVIKDALISGFEPTHGDIAKNRLACLAWLIAENRLEIKIAVPASSAERSINRGLYHEKIGVFRDSIGNKIAFSGSPNETSGGLVDNFESIDVFWSWNDPQGRVSEKESCFDRLWRNETEMLEVIDFPEAAKDKLLTYKTETPPVGDLEEGDNLPAGGMSIREGQIFVLRGYQSDAITKWVENNYRGIMAMATGSGKTKTALSALKQIQVEGQRFIAVIIVPYKHLAEQWYAECKAFNFKAVLCYGDNPNWERDVLQLRTSFLTKTISAAVLVTTYATFPSERFLNAVGRLSPEKILVADEVHHLGAEASRIPLDIFAKRLGLSATPERIYDPEGTQWLLENVGKVVFRFGLDKAIGTCLTPYRYYVHLVYLDEFEQQAYQDVMLQISKACAAADGLREENPDDNARLGQLLRKRQEILGGAKEKIPKLRELLIDSGALVSDSRIAFSLFYASSSLFDEIIRLLSMELHLKVSKFTFEETMEQRRQILSDFSAQKICAIIAKKCLDEGMDIPATRNAFILSSSSNPMEFIQRRGRVLRQFPGKDESIIHDFFVLPNARSTPNPYDKRLVERELKRVIEFASFAKNGVECRNQILPIQKFFNLLHL